MFEPRTSPQNEIAKRRNRSIIDYARPLMMEDNVLEKYQREFVSNVVYTPNQVQVKKGTNQSPFENWNGYAINVNYLKVIGSKCYILKDAREGKHDEKSDEGIFLGYYTKRKVYKCLNSNTNKIMESKNVRVDEFA